MSFKREGDGRDCFKVVKKRRIDELFAEDIPEDEALLMKNGRYCCLVCKHRPIFDTLNMLAVHRQGKKHLASQEWQQQEKLELGRLVKKRQQEELIKYGHILTFHAVGSPGSSVGGQSLLTSAPYNPTVNKQRKLKPNERRPTLQINSSAKIHVPPPATATSTDALPGSSSNSPSNMSNFCSDSPEPVPQTISEFKKLQKHQNKQSTSLVPYIKKANRTTSDKTSHYTDHRTQTASVSGASFSGGSKPHTIKIGPIKTRPSLNQGYTGSMPIVSDTLHHENVSVVKHTVEASKRDGSISVPPVHKQKHNDKCKSGDKGPLNDPVVKGQEVNKAEQYLLARGSGWKKDWDGKWVRDEDAEFDSDEEPPDLP